MNSNSKDFLQNTFSEYYKSSSLQLPDNLEAKQFTAETWDGRIKTNLKHDELNKLLEESTPRQVKCTQKEAYTNEIVFKARLSEDKPRTDISNLQEKVKQTSDVISSDLGFNEQKILFDGDRSFYLVVSINSVQELSEDAIAEIKEYVSAEGFSADLYPSSDTNKNLSILVGNWYGELYRETISYLNTVKELQNEEAAEELMKFDGVGKKTATGILERTEPENYGSILFGEINKTNSLNKLTRKIKETRIDTKTISVSENDGGSVPIENSLNRDTGLKVVSIQPEVLSEFNPYVDSIPDEFTQKTVDIDVHSTNTVELNNEAFDLIEGTVSAPVHVAVFAMLQGFADIKY
jgi:DNA primase small subunit